MIKRKFEGSWTMLPELSFYQEGDAPQSGRYQIDVVEEEVMFSIHWTANEKENAVHFKGPLDGQLHPSDLAPNSFTSYTEVDDEILESSFVVNGKEIGFARRQVSKDGELLAVLQVNRKPDGTRIRITQVYRRT